MKRIKVDSSRERRALISLITSDKYLARAHKVLDLSLIDSPAYRQVAEWCIEHYKRYKKAPGADIETTYHSWAESEGNEELADEVHGFLSGLSKEYSRAKKAPPNVPFLIDELKGLMSQKRLRRVKEDIEYALLKGDVKRGERAITEYNKVSSEESQGSNPMRQDWGEVFSDPMAPIIDLGGDAGKFFGPALTRDALVAIQANEKRGKTHWMIEFMMRALRSRRRVAFFQAGDLSKRQFDMRLAVRWAQRPLWPDQLKDGIFLPKRIKFIDDKDHETGYEVLGKVVHHKHTVSQLSAERGIKKFRRACGIPRKEDMVRTSIHPTHTLTVARIREILERWKQEDGFIPDVIIIDYADILAPEPMDRRMEHDRNVGNMTWMAMRRLAQELYALVITATQAKVKAVKQKLQTEESFADDKRKAAHVTAKFGLNQTPEEKRMGGMRVNCLYLREAPYDIRRPLYVGTCFALGRALCTASLRRPSTKKRRKKVA